MEKNILEIKKKTKEFLDLFGFEGDVVVSKRDRSYQINFQLETPSLLIGRGGEVLDCLQYLFNILFRKKLGFTEESVLLDINNYREKRTKIIEREAKEIAYKVRETGKEIEMPFMNAYERKVAHTMISTISDVKSESRGERADRRLVVMPKS